MIETDTDVLQKESLISKLKKIPQLKELIELDNEGLVDGKPFTVSAAAKLLEEKYGDEPSKSGGLQIDHFYGTVKLLPHPDKTKFTEEGYKHALKDYKDLVVLALLHDVKEDKKAVHHELIKLGLDEGLLHSLEIFDNTKFKKLPGEKNYYIDLFIPSIIHSSELSHSVVKDAEMKNNLSKERFDGLPKEKDKVKFANKYKPVQKPLEKKVLEAMSSPKFKGWEWPDVYFTAKGMATRNIDKYFDR